MWVQENAPQVLPKIEDKLSALENFHKNVLSLWLQLRHCHGPEQEKKGGGRLRGSVG